MTYSKSSKRERDAFFKIQQERESDAFFKIQQERESDDVLKIQQERARERDGVDVDDEQREFA